jgi:YHS domain-containing protein
MLRTLFFRFILPLIAFLILRAVLKAVWGSMSSSVAAQKAKPPENSPSGGELKKDPVCGPYVAANASVTKVVNGEPLYFCSPTCRDRFLSR